MDMSSARWLFDLGMEDPEILNGSSDEFNKIKPYNSHNSSPQKSAKQVKVKNMDSSKAASKIISFGNNTKAELSRGLSFSSNYENLEFSEVGGKKVFPSASSRVPSRAQEHVMAERKRRERLTQRFIALSSLIPGLKKLDKASVLGDAIKYIKQLQERKTTLEKEAEKRSAESVVCVKKTLVSGDDNNSSSDENFRGQALPEIEIRVSDLDVLIRIQCEKNNGIFPKITTEMEKLHLTILSAVAMPFGSTTLEITVIAQLDAEFWTTAKDLVKNLRYAILSVA